MRRHFISAGLAFLMASPLAAAETRVTLHTNMGDIVLALDAEKAPVSVDNFLSYARDGFYDGTIFHRVIDGFMIQGGGFTENLQQKRTRDPIVNEAANGLKNVRGSISMARTPAPHSATAQFFINLKDNDFLDYPSRDGWGYAVFGSVVEGMDVVDAIAKVPTTSKGGLQDVPVDNVIIQKVEVKEE